VQQFQSLGCERSRHIGQAGDIAGRPVEAGDKAELDRVGAKFEDDRNCRSRCLSREGRRGTAARKDHGHLTAD
jgi:hypothetical protein